MEIFFKPPAERHGKLNRTFAVSGRGRSNNDLTATGKRNPSRLAGLAGSPST